MISFQRSVLGDKDSPAVELPRGSEIWRSIKFLIKSCIEIFGISSLYCTSLYRNIFYVLFISKVSGYICLSQKLKLGCFFFPGYLRELWRNFKIKFMHWNEISCVKTFGILSLYCTSLYRKMFYVLFISRGSCQLYLPFSEAETRVFFFLSGYFRELWRSFKI